MTSENGKTINGRKYSFDMDGRMNAEWVIYGTAPTASTSTVNRAALSSTNTSLSTTFQGDDKDSANWRYYGSPEDGARITKDWFKVVPDEFLEEGKNLSFITPNNGKIGTDDYTEYYDVAYKKAETDYSFKYKLVNASGSVQKNKSKAKDGNDRCYVQNSEDIKAIYVED